MASNFEQDLPEVSITTVFFRIMTRITSGINGCEVGLVYRYELSTILTFLFVQSKGFYVEKVIGNILMILFSTLHFINNIIMFRYVKSVKQILRWISSCGEEYMSVIGEQSSQKIILNLRMMFWKKITLN